MYSLALILTISAKLVSGAEADSPPRFVTLIYACDSKGSCAQFRQPFDADNEVACQMAGAMSATRWAVEHPGYVLNASAAPTPGSGNCSRSGWRRAAGHSIEMKSERAFRL